MEKKNAHRRRLATVGVLMGLSIAVGTSLCQIGPAGRKAGLIQFDAINEQIIADSANLVLFARYWVCQDYYVVSIVWSEPRGLACSSMKAMVVLSDKTGVRVANERRADSPGWNMTYPRPFGQRGVPGQGVHPIEMRFADAEALSRRIYISDLATLNDPNWGAGGIIDLKPRKDAGNARRKVAQLRVQAKDRTIESMELLDDQQRLLCRTKYGYERNEKSPRVTKLVADLPERPVKVAVDVNSYEERTADYVYHKGGRTCAVTYKDVAIGDQVLRLPVRVEVRASDDQRLMRSARLMNFHHVDLDKAEVWEAAKAFAHYGSEDQAYYTFIRKYIQYRPKLGPPRVDPNNLAFVRRLIAKYPVRELPALPPPETPPVKRWTPDVDPKVVMQETAARAEAAKREMTRRHELMARIPRPERKDIEPNDARAMRQWIVHYERTRLTQEERAVLKERGSVNPIVTDSRRELADLHSKLERALIYHHAPLLPEDKPPEMEPDDVEPIRQLQCHYEKLAAQEDHGPGGRLKAVCALTSLDRMLRDYDAFEQHAARYLQTALDIGLPNTYMANGYDSIVILVDATQYNKANRLMRQWADRSVAESDVEAILRFASWEGYGPSLSWASVQLLDRLLGKSGLSPAQRYEGLALRAIALHEIDRFLSTPQKDPEPGEEWRKPHAQWILSGTTREDIAKGIPLALARAVSAWQSLGSVRESEAKPYSTDDRPWLSINFLGLSEATRLQETSAKLDQIVRQRMAQPRVAPRSPKARQPAPRPRETRPPVPRR